MMTKSDQLWIKFMEIGHWLGCHQMAERSFTVRGYQFPICARCTGVLVGELIAILLLIIGFRLPYIFILIGMGIMGLDWFVQYMQWKSSTNPRRFITGLACGIGVTYFYFYVFHWFFMVIRVKFM